MVVVVVGGGGGGGVGVGVVVVVVVVVSCHLHVICARTEFAPVPGKVTLPRHTQAWLLDACCEHVHSLIVDTWEIRWQNHCQ